MAYRIRTTRGGKLEFHNRPWMIPLYDDYADRIVIQKCSQVGISDWMICEMLSQARNGKAVMYVLPTDKIVYGFTPRRLDKLILSRPYLRQNCQRKDKDSDTKTQKTLFGVDCHVVGSNAVNNFYEKPCDVLLIDELDRCTQANLPYAYDRLGSAEREIWRKCGNPSVTNFGINKAYAESDAKVWMVKCPHCNEWQELTWFDNFVRDEGGSQFSLRDVSSSFVTSSTATGTGDATPLCRKCERPIDRLAPGQWVKQKQDAVVSGYKISKPWADPRPGPIVLNLFDEFITAQANQFALQRFYNNVLGEPFKAEGAQLTLAMLAECAGEYKMPVTANNTVAGVDVGAVLHVNISEIHNGIRRKVFIGRANDYNDLQILCHRYGVIKGVIDAGPDVQGTREWCRRHPQWYRCFYNLSDTSPDTRVVDHKQRTIRVNRTASLDESYAHWATGQVEIPVDWRTADNGDFAAHMQAPTRIQVERADGSLAYVWDEGSNPDHHFHADNYERLASTLYGGSGSLVTVV